MAILKHIASKSSNYGAALEYLIFKHDEIRKAPILDQNGNRIMRDEFYLDGLNCEPYSFDAACQQLNREYQKNKNKNEIKSHHYIISFDPRDSTENCLTGKRAQELGLEYAKANFPGHQALVCTHMDGHNGSGNIHVHIVINSLRKLDVPQQPFMERPIDCKAGYKHHVTNEYLKHLQKSLMDLCQREFLHQVDLLSPSRTGVTEAEYWAQRWLDEKKQEIEEKGFTPNPTKFQTQKQLIRDAVAAAREKAISYEDFQEILQDEYDVFVKTQRGRYSYLLPERNKFISERSLGDSCKRECLEGFFIINASYSRDLSAKIAAADHVMQKKGMYLGGYRPFGFLPDPNDCHKLILDPVASQYVRLIFELALQGNRTGTIAKILNEKQIPTPAAYHVAENHVYSEQKAWDLQRSHWTSGTVYHVLKNEKYKGTYVGAKFIMPVPYKHRVLRAPLEQQVRIEDSHAAIVTPEEFEQAQKVIMLQNGNHQTGNYTKHQYPLKGKVYCGYCQKLMKYRVLKKLGPSFNCRFSATAVDSPCKRIPISEEILEHIVRNALTEQIKQAEHILGILHERERKALICFSTLERQEEKLSAEKEEIVKQRVALYEQYADGNMSKEEFIRQRDAYRVQEDERMAQIQRLRTEKNQVFQPVKKDTDNLQAVMNTVGEAGDVMHLSQNVVETFIDRIEVFNDERVKIRFTFEDALNSCEEK